MQQRQKTFEERLRIVEDAVHQIGLSAPGQTQSAPGTWSQPTPIVWHGLVSPLRLSAPGQSQSAPGQAQSAPGTRSQPSYGPSRVEETPSEKRLRIIEEAVCKLAGPSYGTCPVGQVSPTFGPDTKIGQVSPTVGPGNQIAQGLPPARPGTHKSCELAVMFESHCGDSKKFIHQRLVPTWPKLEPHCSLDLVPFGKANRTEDGIVCQHGEKECRGNMVLSCALARLPPGQPQLDFTSCFMADPDCGGPECAQKSGLHWEEIESCMASEEGVRLQQEAESKSYSIKQSGFVPTIMINKNYNPDEQNQAVKGDFESLMCQYVDNPKMCS